MEQLLSIVMEASECLANCKTQDWLFTYLETERSSNCSTSASIQSLEKSSVAFQQNFLYWDLSLLHWFCELTLRECLLTTVNRTKEESDPGLGAAQTRHGAGGPPEGYAVDPWHDNERWRCKERSMIMDSHIRSIKFWWEMRYGSSLAQEVENLVWGGASSRMVTLCLVAGSWGLCCRFGRLLQVTVSSGNTWFHCVSHLLHSECGSVQHFGSITL